MLEGTNSKTTIDQKPALDLEVLNNASSHNKQGLEHIVFGGGVRVGTKWRGPLIKEMQVMLSYSFLKVAS